MLSFLWSALALATPTQERAMMVETQLVARGIRDPAVLQAMGQVPRHEFVPSDRRPHAYADRPLPIGHRQTISQPYIVAFMTEALQVEPGQKVLEIGTGSGYQAAVLAAVGARVWTIEIVEPLGLRARGDLDRLGFGSVVSRVGDGYAGWPEVAPFDRIIVTAAPNHVPQPLLEQLTVGGRMVIPVGDQVQELLVIERTGPETWRRSSVLGVVFVPMTGEAETR